jgi:hypothetical protein
VSDLLHFVAGIFHSVGSREAALVVVGFCKVILDMHTWTDHEFAVLGWW